MTQMITTRKLIDANRRALAEKTLSGFSRQGGGCYINEDGTRCAIGVTFDPEFLQNTVKGTIRNVQRINILVERSSACGPLDVRVENLSVAYLTQRLHDAWAAAPQYMTLHDYDKRYLRHVTHKLESFFCSHYDQPVTESVFRDWIDLLDATYPAEGAA